MTNVRPMPPRSTVEVVLIRDTWMVRQDMTSEDAREVAYQFGTRDGVYRELMDAAETCDERNEERDW